MMANQHYLLFSFFRALVNDWLVFVGLYLSQLKTALEALFSSYYPLPIDQLLVSMVFGRTTQFNKDLHLKFNIIGMLHVVCASGFNVNLVTSLFEKPLKIIWGRKAIGWLLIGLVWFYCALAQSGVALIRAGTMITLKILCRNIFLSQLNFVASFYLSCLLLLLVKFEWWQSISFQLTVAATWGMIFLVPALKKLLKEIFGNTSFINYNQIACWLVDSVATTLAAQLAVLPLILFYFGQFSWISLIANSLILWLTPLITWSGLVWSLLVALFNLLRPDSGGLLLIPFILSWFVALPVNLFLKLVDWFAGQGRLRTVNNFSVIYVIIWYFTLIILYKMYKIILKKVIKNSPNETSFV